jgi:predicted DNA-binding protein
MKRLISLQLEEDLIARVKLYAQKTGRTLSGVIRLALETYLSLQDRIVSEKE